MWSIIHFLDENTVATVPCKWYSNKKCAWPNTNVKKFVEDQTSPNKEYFKWYKARELLTNIGKYINI